MRSLVIYYTKSGNTGLVAHIIKRELKAHIKEITDYTNERTVLDYLFTSLIDSASINPRKINVDYYETIFIGSPVWFGSLTPAIKKIIDNIDFKNIGVNIGKVFKSDYIGTYAKGELCLAFAVLAFAAIGLMKSLPKHEYTDIEHGSSDWATGGEQYQILSPKKGIILAEKNYLPVDKRGNVNVLVVGRFWFW